MCKIGWIWNYSSFLLSNNLRIEFHLSLIFYFFYGGLQLKRTQYGKSMAHCLAAASYYKLFRSCEETILHSYILLSHSTTKNYFWEKNRDRSWCECNIFGSNNRKCVSIKSVGRPGIESSFSRINYSFTCKRGFLPNL